MMPKLLDTVQFSSATMRARPLLCCLEVGGLRELMETARRLADWNAFSTYCRLVCSAQRVATVLCGSRCVADLSLWISVCYRRRQLVGDAARPAFTLEIFILTLYFERQVT